MAVLHGRAAVKRSWRACDAHWLCVTSRFDATIASYEDELRRQPEDRLSCCISNTRSQASQDHHMKTAERRRGCIRG